jgi:hypothetical protein
MIIMQSSNDKILCKDLYWEVRRWKVIDEHKISLKITNDKLSFITQDVWNDYTIYKKEMSLFMDYI